MRIPLPSISSVVSATPRILAVAALPIALAFFVALALLPAAAYAQQIQVPFVEEFGCSVVQWLKGPAAILIFVLVSVATLVVGMITRMDWARIVAVCVIFGIVVSSGAVFASSRFVQNVPGISACLQ